jgi:hypothetical protein
MPISKTQLTYSNYEMKRYKVKRLAERLKTSYNNGAVIEAAG